MGGKNYPLITWIIGRRATYCFGTLAQHDTQTNFKLLKPQFVSNLKLNLFQIYGGQQP
jgi:hypothetical protein